MADWSTRPLRMTERDRALFVNRQRELGAVTSILLQGGNVLLLGDRGIGKTSFLYRVAERMLEQGRNVAFVGGRVAETPMELIARIVDEVGDWRPASAAPDSESAEPTLQLRLAAEAMQSPSKLLIDAMRMLRQALRDRRGTIIVDEPDAVVARTVFGRLRDELWELDLSWCVSMERSVRAPLVTPPADAFWSRVVELGPLDDDDLLAALARRAADENVPVEVGEDLVRQAVGNPRQLFQLATAVMSGGDSLVDLRRANQARAAKLDAVSAPARRLFAELEAMGATSPSDVDLQARLNWSRGRLSQLFKELREADLVRSSTQRAGAGRPRTVFEVAR